MGLDSPGLHSLHPNQWKPSNPTPKVFLATPPMKTAFVQLLDLHMYKGPLLHPYICSFLRDI